MTLEEAANRIHLGRSIAFFGSAFSKDATNLLDDPMLPGGALAKRLCADIGEDAELPLDLAAQLYQKSGSSPDIRDLIRDFFSARTVADYQILLSCLPWRRIFTTNYDNVIEKCRRDAGLSVNSPTVIDHPADYAGMFSIVHLHGYVERLTKEDWDQAYVLTNTQYAADHLSRNGWLEAFRNDAHYADAIFFFGYSLADLDIARLMYENPSVSANGPSAVGSADTDAMPLAFAGAVRAFLCPHWLRWHATWGSPAPITPSQWTCVRSSLFLTRAIGRSGISAALRSGQPTAAAGGAGLHVATGWMSHAWVEAAGRVIDITADQFGLAAIIVTSCDDPAYRAGAGADGQLAPTPAGIAAVDAIWPSWREQGDRLVARAAFDQRSGPLATGGSNTGVPSAR